MASALGNVTFVNGFPVPVFATNKLFLSFRTMAHYHACLTLGICLSADFLVSVFASQYLKKLSLSAHFAYQCLEMGVFCKVFVRSNVFVTAFRILVGNPCLRIRCVKTFGNTMLVKSCQGISRNTVSNGLHYKHDVCQRTSRSTLSTHHDPPMRGFTFRMKAFGNTCRSTHFS